ncbi:MAG: hypothetical protein JSV62_01980 [Promethearchaeota archaeon]|nr:MAG: hypothetical protein JSV62_01980 [Candidatus Lokiarchaeota archaeon]
MGFSIKELTYLGNYLIYLSEQELTGPWFSFKLEGKKIGTIPVILRNIEPTPIYNMVNTRTGTQISRITLDFNITEYLKKLVQDGIIPSLNFEKKEFVRVYKDIFNRPKVPYISTFFTIKNISDFALKNFSIYFVFDFDINGLKGYDNDMSGYDEENDVIYQYDDTGLYGGFSPISKSTNYESCLTRDFIIDQHKMNLSNTLYRGQGEILSALQIEFITIEPDHTFQTALVISGGFSKEELIENIKEGKNNAMKHLHQVNRSVKSEQRNIQEEAFIKINLQQAEDCK